VHCGVRQTVQKVDDFARVFGFDDVNRGTGGRAGLQPVHQDAVNGGLA